MLPKQFPDYRHVNYYHLKWTRDGTWDTILDVVRQIARNIAGIQMNQPLPFLIVNRLKQPDLAKSKALMVENLSKDENDSSLWTHWDVSFPLWLCVPRCLNPQVALKYLTISINGSQLSRTCGLIALMVVNS